MARTVKQLEESVVQAVIHAADEHDYCEQGAVDFIADALMLPREKAEKLFDSYRKKFKVKLVVEFETTYDDLWLGILSDNDLKAMINDHLLDGYSLDTITILSSSYKEIK